MGDRVRVGEQQGTIIRVDDEDNQLPFGVGFDGDEAFPLWFSADDLAPAS